MVGMCKNCTYRASLEEMSTLVRQHLERAKRVEYYRKRASLGLPLFDPPYPEDEE